MKPIRCVGCGKIIEGKAVRVTKGEVAERFRVAEEFGMLHQSCFDELTESPDILLNTPEKPARKSPK